jgi:hypothetical protein
MVRNNGAGNWCHNGSLPGTTTIMVRTATRLLPGRPMRHLTIVEAFHPRPEASKGPQD